MKILQTVVVLVLLGCLAANSSALQQIEGNTKIENAHENTLSKFLTSYNGAMWTGNPERVKRSMKEDIEKGFKEFSEKVGKLPDKLNASLKKYFEERGISMESIQKILGDIWDAVEKLIDEVKKAL